MMRFIKVILSVLLLSLAVFTNAQQMPPPYPPPQPGPGSPGVPPPPQGPYPPNMAEQANNTTQNTTNNSNAAAAPTANQNFDQLFKNADVDHFGKQDAAPNIFGGSGEQE